jgi:hypothetical protein
LVQGGSNCARAAFPKKPRQARKRSAGLDLTDSKTFAAKTLAAKTLAAKTSAMTGEANDRRLPEGEEIFLDHVGHFVAAVEPASRALERAGFAPTAPSVQLDARANAAARLTGTGNVTAMLAQGYIEVLFQTADTALGREFGAALARHAGIHLVAFAVADAARTRARLSAAGFRMRPLAKMQRPVATASGNAVAAFSVVRVEPDMMPEGRIQMLTHHTEEAVWQPRWLSHPNTAMALIDVVIAVADVQEAAMRFARFCGRAAEQINGGAIVRLDRGAVLLVGRDALTNLLPEVPMRALPFTAGYAIGVQSLATAAAIVQSAKLQWRAFDGGIVVSFPDELGAGAFFFVESAAALPWRGS